MKTYQYLTVVLAITLLIAACSPAATPIVQPTTKPVSQPTAIPTTVPTLAPTAEPTASGPNTGLQTRPQAAAWANAPQAALAARAMLVAKLAVDPDAIVLVSAEQIDWPDACLGVQTPGKMCAQVITPGYKVVLSAQGNQYEFHTNADGSSILQAAQPSSGVIKPGGMMLTQQQAQIWASAPQAALLARGDLMQRLHVDPDTIGLVSVDKVDWPDSCLGVSTAGKACAQVVTPGYKIVLGGGTRQYEYHTDETGSHLILVNP